MNRRIVEVQPGCGPFNRAVPLPRRRALKGHSYGDCENWWLVKFSDGTEETLRSRYVPKHMRQFKGWKE